MSLPVVLLRMHKKNGRKGLERGMYSNITCWLDETADRFPDKAAYADADTVFTFGETRKRALDLAAQMVSLSLFHQPVAIYMEKTVDMLTAFFAVAYSGNFYSPVDVEMPESRISRIFAYLKPRLIITKKELQPKISQYAPGIACLCMDEEDARECEHGPVYEQRARTCDTDLLYVLFTSGSTGIPKGVTITHRAVMDYIDCVVEMFGIDESDCFGNQAPFYFDNSVLDIYTVMKTGASMHIIPHKLFAWPVRLLEYLDTHKINNLFWVPSALSMLSKLKALEHYDMRGKLKRVLFAGEVMPNKQLNIWRKCLPDVQYANLYGPTEITVDCTCYMVDREFSDDEPLPIGKAMANTEVLVFNEKDELVSGDEIGELCVKGTSLSMGYYNNPEKTKEVFVQNPLNTAYPEMIYRTGDLVRFNERGELIYLCRKDFQIKHLGHRIELGEIETAASSLDSILACCCLYDEERSRIVLIVEGQQDFALIREKLSDRLPDYMLPGRLICVDAMPMNDNGKIDRVKLKEML